MNIKEEILKLHLGGHSLRAISRQLGIPKSTVAFWINEQKNKHEKNNVKEKQIEFDFSDNENYVEKYAEWVFFGGIFLLLFFIWVFLKKYIGK